jgi:protein SCO1/2
MQRRAVFLFAAILLLAACSSKSNQRTYAVHGQVVSVTPDRQEATVKHGEIVGLMPAMTMPYKIREKAELNAVKPGDVIDATLTIVENDAFLTGVRKVGEAPLEAAPPEPTTVTTAPRPELLKPGDVVPDTPFVDQDRKKRTFNSFRGSMVVLTFIYTRCPLPTFCPMMDRHFITIQERMHDDPALKKVHLVTVTFDPAYDTPDVLKKHARELNADLSRWTFLTGDQEAIEKFAARFGVFVARASNDPRDITHNLRTAIVGPDGKLIKVYTGNEWTPEEILDDLKPVANAD